jgi:glycerophosphoryl diester phosphodiesterase
MVNARLVNGVGTPCYSNPVQPAILVHGHRGARALRPENTLPAFEYAIAAGADALEMDVAVTRDDVVVVSHDAKLNRRICTSPGGPATIRQLTLAELACWDCGALRHPRFRRQMPVPHTHPPTLAQVLSLANRGNFLFNIEIKSYPRHPELTPPPEPFVELVWNVIREHRLENRVIVQSFDFRVLHAMRDRAPEIRLAALYAGRPKSFVRLAREAGTRIVAPHHTLVRRRNARAAHDAGLQVVVWTANQPRQWKRLIAAQVDGIITDDPAALIAYLTDRGLRLR